MVSTVSPHLIQLKRKSIHAVKDISVIQMYSMNKHVRLARTVVNSASQVKLSVLTVTMDFTVAKLVKLNWSEFVMMATTALVARMTNPISHHVQLVSVVTTV